MQKRDEIIKSETAAKGFYEEQKEIRIRYQQELDKESAKISPTIPSDLVQYVRRTTNVRFIGGRYPDVEDNTINSYPVRVNSSYCIEIKETQELKNIEKEYNEAVKRHESFVRDLKKCT